MRVVLAVSLLLASSSLASAGVLAGTTLGVQPADKFEGGFGVWLAGTIGKHAFVGSDISMTSYMVQDDGGISYHALAGVTTRLSERVVVIADAGAGATQRFTTQLGPGMLRTLGWMPSTATRVQLVREIGDLGGSTVGLALATEARLGYTDDRAVAGFGIGVGLVLSR